jgi:hypothetical protein
VQKIPFTCSLGDEFKKQQAANKAKQNQDMPGRTLEKIKQDYQLAK